MRSTLSKMKTKSSDLDLDAAVWVRVCVSPPIFSDEIRMVDKHSDDALHFLF